MFIKLTDNEILCPEGGFMVVNDSGGVGEGDWPDVMLKSVHNGTTAHVWYGQKAEQVWAKFEFLAIEVRNTAI